MRIILPDGAQDIKIELWEDLEVDSVELGTFYGTLDYIGRPMIIIKKKNVMYTLATGPARIYYNC